MARRAAESAERVRFCDHCNAITGYFATYCEECGRSLKSDTGGGDAARKAAGPLEDLFRAHMRLLHRFRERTEEIRKRAVRLQRSLQTDEGIRGREARERLLVMSERLLELEEEWEEVQKDYNRQSESLDEELSGRGDRPQIAADLDPGLQTALRGEFGTLFGVLEAIQKTLRETGRELDLATTRIRSRVFGVPTGGRGALLAGVLVAFGLLAAGVALGHFALSIPLQPLLLSQAPAALGIAVLWMIARSR